MKQIAVFLAALMLSGRALALCIAPLCTCGISTTSVVFSAYNPLTSGHVDSSGNVRVSCGGVAGLLIPYNLALSSGNAAGQAQRYMTNGAARLNYNLYQDSTYAGLWGDNTSGAPLLTGGILLDLLGLSPPNQHRVYGRIQGNQVTAIPGTYVDQIYVTITYF